LEFRLGLAARLSPPGSQPRPSVEPRSGSEDALTALAELVRDDFAACNRVIVQNMQSQVELIPRLAAHLVAAGGKRLRPILTLASARLCGYPGGAGGTRHVNLAACVEFIHTATLLHDDVVDESQLRRGLASANAVFGNQASVLVGDFLFSRAFQLMTADGSLHVLRILSDAAATIAEGEVLQLVTQNDLSTEVDRYLEVIQGKTAALFAAAWWAPWWRTGPRVRSRRWPISARRSAWRFSSWMTLWITRPISRSWARRSATIFARARSPCLYWPPITPAARPSVLSGAAP
jgi:hypothetical protein